MAAVIVGDLLLDCEQSERRPAAQRPCRDLDPIQVPLLVRKARAPAPGPGKRGQPDVECAMRRVFEIDRRGSHPGDGAPGTATTAARAGSVAASDGEQALVQYERAEPDLVVLDLMLPKMNGLDILRRIPKLRKVSMNYRIHVDRGAAAVGSDYVFSYKPNPACFATDAWNLGKARDELRHMLDCTKGGHVEIVMKDISTIAGQPQRVR